MAFNRRNFLKIGAGVASLPLFSLSTVTAASHTDAPPSLMFVSQPYEEQAKALATTPHDLIILDRDPMFLFRQNFTSETRLIAGITRWHEFTLLRGLAADHGLRQIEHRTMRIPGQAMAVEWIIRT